MLNKKLENSVRSLTSLYTVVIGVALSSAILILIEPEKGLNSLTASSLLLFLAFVITLFPFYHGALRHLDDAYIENDNAHIKDGALIFDFILLFLHGMFFVLLSLMLLKPGHFAWVMMTILSIDVIWGLFTHFGSSSSSGSAEWKWTIINTVTVIISITLAVVFEIYLQPVSNPEKISLVIFGICFLRTMVDYMWGWKFYFPRIQTKKKM